jgi:serine/threonine protein kinase
MPIPRNHRAEPLARSEFEAVLRSWYRNSDEETIGGTVRYGGTPWLWIVVQRDLYHLNADTKRAGVEEYLDRVRTEPELLWTVIEGRAGKRTKVVFGADRRAISGFYLYGTERRGGGAESPGSGAHGGEQREASSLERYAGELDREIAAVFRRNPALRDHRQEFPWLQGWLGDPFAGVWFVGENPSLGMVERQQDRHGRTATPEAQWAASRGDQLLRRMLAKHGFKEGSAATAGGWRCYLTNVVKEADYTSRWRENTKDHLLRAAEIWAPVLCWELEAGRPHLVVAMGKQPLTMLRHLQRSGLVELPRVVGITHYAYIGQRADGNRGPMHGERVAEYEREFAEVARLARSNATRTAPGARPLPSTPLSVPAVTDTQAAGERPVRNTDPAPRATAGFASLLLGLRLGGRYRIEALVGRGGMGAVYRAVDERLEREVALKVISIEATDTETMERLRSRFRREARAAARLRHPNVVAVHDYGTEERLGLDFLIMELLEGEDLAARITRPPPVPLPLAVRILTEASNGVAAGHQAGLVHRDVKPANLFLERADAHGNIRVRVLDSGIAQIMDGGDDTLTHLTLAGSGPLSPAYAAPEQLRGTRELTPAADVFSLGITGFQMLTGARPFVSAEIQQIAGGRVVPVPSARAREPRVPEALDRVLRRAMSLLPQDRYPDAGEFASALRHAAGDLDLIRGSPGVRTGESARREAHLPAISRSDEAGPGGDHAFTEQYPAPKGRFWRAAGGPGAAGDDSRAGRVPTAAELEGRVLSIKPEVLRQGNPRRPFTHGWLAFEILLRDGDGRMPFDEYRKRLFDPGPEIRSLAKQIPGEPDAYQNLKHIRHDIRCGRVVVE